MVTGWLSVPEGGEMLVMTGSSVKPLGAFAGTPFTVTVTVPFTPAVGTGTTMVLLVHVVGVPTSPLNETVLLLCVGPNPDPVNVTTVPMLPEVGLMLTIDGGGKTVNSRLLLETPAA